MLKNENSLHISKVLFIFAEWNFNNKKIKIMSFKIDISLPNVSKLNNDEYAQFIKGVVKLVNTTTVEKLGVKPELITAIEKNLDLLTEASRQSRSSKESENINRLDKQRNELLSYLLSS